MIIERYAVILSTLAIVSASSLQAQENKLSAKTNMALKNGTYTSQIEHTIPEASCVPCDNDEGDNHTFQEPIPYPLDPKTARLYCEGDGCVFNQPQEVKIDNKGRIATAYIRSRSIAVKVRIRGEILSYSFSD